MDSADPHQLPDETIDLGRRELARLRQRIGADTDRPGRLTIRRPPAEPLHPETSSVDRMTAEMAAGAERERLEARIQQLELEVAQLRSALAQVLEAAATGLGANRRTSGSYDTLPPQ